jgi:hypothetical protein
MEEVRQEDQSPAVDEPTTAPVEEASESVVVETPDTPSEEKPAAIAADESSPSDEATTETATAE